jgi:type IV fimbrial biogenesis protein FimT
MFMPLRYPTTVQIRRSRGFNLLELMIVLAIVGILVTVATPSWKTIVINNRTRAAVNDWIASTQFARSEALRTNGPVTLCASTNGSSCSTSGGYFENGWIVITGTSATEGTLLQDTIAKDGVTMTPNTTGFRALTFLPNGLPTGNFSGMRITVRDGNLNTSDSLNKYICMARTGRTRVFTEAQWLALPNNSCST